MNVIPKIIGGGGGGGGLDQSEVDARVVAVVSGKQQWWLKSGSSLRGTGASTPTLSWQPFGTHNAPAFAMSPSGWSIVRAQIVMPARWDEGSFRMRGYWINSSANTGDVRFDVATQHAGDHETPGGNVVETYVLDAGSGTSGNSQITDWTPSFTISGAEAGDLLLVEFARQGDHADDTYTGTAYLWGVQIEWTSDATNDD